MRSSALISSSLIFSFFSFGTCARERTSCDMLNNAERVSDADRKERKRERGRERERGNCIDGRICQHSSLNISLLSPIKTYKSQCYS
jgi:hypothetical protein